MEKAPTLMLIMAGIKEIFNLIKKMVKEFKSFITNQHTKENL